MFLQIDDVSVQFDGHRALDGVTLGVEHREIVTVLGPSGSGKSTLLRVVAGLQAPERGRVGLDGVDLTDRPTHQRGVGLMFQDYALFPHRDVAGNVGFGLRMAGWDKSRLTARVGEVLELVGLPGFASRPIDDLSGGEQQRIALARALAPSPQVLLLDEPLGALDRALREHLMGELAALFAELELTVVLVTHDRDEAFSLGHRVAVMDQGRIRQVAPPDELWGEPADSFVARFLGHTAIVPARIVEGRVHTDWGLIGAAAPGHGTGPVELLIRSEQARLGPPGDRPGPESGLALPGTVEALAPRGPMVLYTVRIGDIVLEVWHPDGFRVGDPVTVGVEGGAVVVLPV
ncbi:MAG: ABC transporter ATP-binding protein [Actinomycetia bacterium]|nr:ABC transporter ATP-binding protein [Actinomycetes bacterium]